MMINTLIDNVKTIRFISTSIDNVKSIRYIGRLSVVNLHIYLLEYKPGVIQGKARNTFKNKSGNSQEKVRKNRSENYVATLNH